MFTFVVYVPLSFVETFLASALHKHEKMKYTAKSTVYNYFPDTVLLAAMSENRVQVALESRHTGSLPCVLQIPLACQVWAHTAGTDSVPNSSSFLGACAIPDIPTSLSE